jgi:hypothetical protein
MSASRVYRRRASGGGGLGAYRFSRYATMIELVSLLSIRIKRCDGEEPIKAPLGSDPAPMMAVSGLIVALRATLRRRVWCMWGTGSNVELRLVSDNKADKVLYMGARSVELAGGSGRGSAGVSGGERIEVLANLPP